MDNNIYKLMYEISAGIPRIISNCFMESQKQALVLGLTSISNDILLNVYHGFSDDLKMTIMAIHNKDLKFLSTKPDYKYEKF